MPLPHSRFLLTLLCVFLAIGASAPAGGLHISLNTSESSIVIGQPAPGVPEKQSRKKNGDPVRAVSIAASVALFNRSDKDIDFTFPDSATASYKWIFRLLNSEGTELWRSDSDVFGLQVLTPVTLKSRERWTRTLRIPLVIDGTPLAPGQYSVAADLAAGSEIGARALLKVVAASDDQLRTGIRGKVTRGGRPAAGAMIQINELRDPNARYAGPAFSWTGISGPKGEFAVPTPAGTFSVEAGLHRPHPQPDPSTKTVSSDANGLVPIWHFPGTASEIVSVAEGEVAEVALELGIASRHPQGILGQVFVKPLNRTNNPDDTADNPVPMARAVIRVEEIREVDIMIYPPRPLFQWTGAADSQGKFKAPTPPGRFRVTASPPPPPRGFAEIMIYRPPAVAEVFVEPSVWTEATLWFDPSFGGVITE